jgi:hypothetical protein
MCVPHIYRTVTLFDVMFSPKHDSDAPWADRHYISSPNSRAYGYTAVLWLPKANPANSNITIS